MDPSGLFYAPLSILSFRVTFSLQQTPTGGGNHYAAKEELQ
jgi:hypothetical protein